MSSHLTDAPPQRHVAISQRRAAVIAGLAYVVIIALGLFANFRVLGTLTEPDDAAATVRNITNSEVLFRSGVAAFIIVLIADVVVAWGYMSSSSPRAGSCRYSPRGSDWCTWPSPEPRC